MAVAVAGTDAAALQRIVDRPAFDHAALVRWCTTGLDWRYHTVDSSRPDAWQQCRHMRTSACVLSATSTSTKQEDDKSSALSDEATPENCDRIVEEIRYRNIRIPQQLDLSLWRRVTMMGRTMVSSVRGMLAFVASIPGKLAAASRMSLSEWRETFSGWWDTIKHEAKHYWVCCPPHRNFACWVEIADNSSTPAQFPSSTQASKCASAARGQITHSLKPPVRCNGRRSFAFATVRMWCCRWASSSSALSCALQRAWSGSSYKARHLQGGSASSSHAPLPTSSAWCLSPSSSSCPSQSCCFRWRCASFPTCCPAPSRLSSSRCSTCFQGMPQLPLLSQGGLRIRCR